MKGPVANLTGLKVDRRNAPEGPAGPAGESAYQAAVRLGYRGTERQWLESLRGPPGSSAGTTYDWAADIHAATDKAVPDDADELGLVDSAASWAKKKLTWANLKAAFQTVFDALYIPSSYLDTDGTLAANSDTKVATQKAGKTYADARLIDAKAYTDAQVVGLWDDRGSFDASVNAYPSSGGSGPAGAILKGDIWTISVAGMLPTAQAVEVNDTVRALVDTPGNTQANWAIAKDNTQTSVSGNAGTATALQTSRNIDGQAFNGTADITVIAPGTHAATSKGTPVDADELPLADSAASWVIKKLTWANIKTTLKAYFDTLYAPSGNIAIRQIVNAQTSAAASGTGTMAIDDTPPQNYEGDEYLTLSITPSSAANNLKIEVVAYLTNSSTDQWLIGALFQDSGVDALAAGIAWQATAHGAVCMQFNHYMPAGTTSATVFKFRAGCSGLGTTTFNGISGTRYMGGVFASSITITEIVP